MVQYVVQSDSPNLSDTFVKSFVSAYPDFFPNIRILLVLACTVPATSAEAESSFSVLRLIKSNWRSWLIQGFLP